MKANFFIVVKNIVIPRTCYSAGQWALKLMVMHTNSVYVWLLFWCRYHMRLSCVYDFFSATGRSE